MNNFTRVIIESPFAGDVERNKRYLAACMRDCILNHKEAPFASHGLYTVALDDNNPVERDAGIKAGFAWGCAAQKVVVYYDFGVSGGMKLGIENANKLDLPVEMRRLPACLMKGVKYPCHP